MGKLRGRRGCWGGIVDVWGGRSVGVAAIERGLGDRWSPQRISARLKVDHPDDEMMRISHETIYQSLYVQSRGELRRQLTAQLRTGRSTRRSHGRVEVGGRIVRVVSIAERRPEVDDCRVPGALGGRSVGRRRREARDRDAG
jgi:IS30 family transposase